MAVISRRSDPPRAGGRVYRQERGVFGVIKRELRRRSAIEPVIGHMKAEGHLGRCYLKSRAGDAIKCRPQRGRLQFASRPRLDEDVFCATFFSR